MNIDLSAAGKVVSDDKIAFWILENFPESYEGLAVQFYPLNDADFKVHEIKKQLLF